MVCIGQGFFKEVAVLKVYSLTRPALGLGHLGLGPILEKRPSNVVGVGVGWWWPCGEGGGGDKRFVIIIIIFF